MCLTFWCQPAFSDTRVIAVSCALCLLASGAPGAGRDEGSTAVTLMGYNDQLTRRLDA